MGEVASASCGWYSEQNEAPRSAVASGSAATTGTARERTAGSIPVFSKNKKPLDSDFLFWSG